MMQVYFLFYRGRESATPSNSCVVFIIIVICDIIWFTIYCIIYVFQLFVRVIPCEILIVAIFQNILLPPR